MKVDCQLLTLAFSGRSYGCLAESLLHFDYLWASRVAQLSQLSQGLPGQDSPIALAGPFATRATARLGPAPSGYGPARGPADADSPTRTRRPRAWRRRNSGDQTGRLGLKRSFTLADLQSGACHRHDDHN